MADPVAQIIKLNSTLEGMNQRLDRIEKALGTNSLTITPDIQIESTELDVETLALRVVELMKRDLNLSFVTPPEAADPVPTPEADAVNAVNAVNTGNPKPKTMKRGT